MVGSHKSKLNKKIDVFYWLLEPALYCQIVFVKKCVLQVYSKLTLKRKCLVVICYSSWTYSIFIADCPKLVESIGVHRDKLSLFTIERTATSANFAFGVVFCRILSFRCSSCLLTACSFTTSLAFVLFFTTLQNILPSFRLTPSTLQIKILIQKSIHQLSLKFLAPFRLLLFYSKMETHPLYCCTLKNLSSFLNSQVFLQVLKFHAYCRGILYLLIMCRAEGMLSKYVGRPCCTETSRNATNMLFNLWYTTQGYDNKKVSNF